MNSTLRPYVTVGIALVGAGLIVATPVAALPSDVQFRAVQLTDVDTTSGADPEIVAYFNGGSGEPVLSPDRIANANEVYVLPHFPGAIPRVLGHPAELYPLEGPHSGPLDDSENASQQIINAVVQTQVGEGHHVIMWGSSGGATENSMEMRYLASLPPDQQPSPDLLNFILWGDPNNDNGGMLDRFDIPGIQTQTFPNLADGALGGLQTFTGSTGVLSFPTLGLTFNGPTPSDTPYPTTIYTGEYDGFADFPKYPLDLLADLNALFGIDAVHNGGFDRSAAYIATAIPWQTSPGYDGDTTWYLVPTPDLPLLDTIRNGPIGDAIADLLQPDLKVLVNLGYGPDNVGYSEYPNVFTPMQPGLPDVNPATLLNELVAGGKQGIQDFMTDLKGITPSSMLASLTSALPAATPVDLDPSNFVDQLQILLTDNANALALLVTTPTQTLMPFMDTLAGLFINVPAYDMNLGALGLQQLADGNLNDALTYFRDIPAADTGLFAIQAIAIMLQSVFSTAEDTITSAIQGAITADKDFLAGLPGLF